MTSSIKSSILLHEKVKADLRQRILRGKIKPDATLGSEHSYYNGMM
ncbi:MAG: hypothetical protein ABII89_03180 [Candidatus Omnitrophota bacterium]